MWCKNYFTREKIIHITKVKFNTRKKKKFKRHHEFYIVPIKLEKRIVEDVLFAPHSHTHSPIWH